MSSNFLHGDRLREKIVDVLKGKRRDLAVAFIGAGALERLGLPSPKGTRLICDLLSGNCNPEAIRSLYKAGVEIKNLENLHAKVFLGDSAAVVGSANLSANGFGDSNAPQDWGLEAGVLLNAYPELEDIANWFDAQFAKASNFDPDDTRLDEAWERRQRRPQLFDNTREFKGIIKTAILNPLLFGNIGFVFTKNEVEDEDYNIAIDTEKVKNNIDDEDMDNWRPGTFARWSPDEINTWPRNFFAYHRGPRGGIYVDAFNLRFANPRAYYSEEEDEWTGYVISKEDWVRICGTVVNGVTKHNNYSLDKSVANEIFEKMDVDGILFLSVRELCKWYIERFGNDGIF